MTADQVSDVYAVADDLEDRLLILGLAGWGLQLNELASLRASQLAPSGDDPHITFDEHKSGPGTVAFLYDTDAVVARIDVLVANDDRNGVLSPSSWAASGHITHETVNRRFKRLVDEAGVAVNDEAPTAKLCRRF